MQQELRLKLTVWIVCAIALVSVLFAYWTKISQRPPVLIIGAPYEEPPIQTPVTDQSAAQMHVGSGLSGGESARSSSRADKLTDPSQGHVNINTASIDDLERLPGVGPAMAQRILNYRQTAGGFHSTDDLGNVQGLGPKKIAKILPYLDF